MGDGKCHEKYYDEGLRLAREFPKDRPIQSVARKYDETFKCIFQMIAQIEERREAFPTPRVKLPERDTLILTNKLLGFEMEFF